MASWTLLPVEIWLEISHFVRSSGLRNLANLSHTCSQLALIARPILYSDLTLNTVTQELERNLSAAHTFSLLARDVYLARSVRSLTLDGRAEAYEINETPILVHPASLRNMSQLRQLTIIGRVFDKADEDLKMAFIQALCGLPLEGLSIPSPGGCFYMFSEDQFGQIANLKSIKCYSDIDEHVYFGPRCLLLVSNSPSSLTTLSLSAMYMDANWVLQLFALRFPLLESLTLDTWEEGMHSPTGFHDFLLAHHHTLVHLDMHYTPRQTIDFAALVFDDNDLLPPQCLPHLRTFNGHCRNVTSMSKAGIHCLNNSLTKLTIGVGRVDDARAEIDQMFDAVQTGCLSALKELDFDVFQSQAEEREWITPFILRWGAICGPSLEIWRGLFPFAWSWSPEELASFFGAFSKLRVIWIANDSTVFGVFPRGEDGEQEKSRQLPAKLEDYVRNLAQKCCSLEEVWIKWAYITCWKIERGPGSRLAVRRAD
ncbi:hypothetical protein B0H19DRAFT_1098860 [Mycena capillaripes]|nr:hypothetical protein B0H19DRAFT_1098860 [Mycena capillaripes]